MKIIRKRLATAINFATASSLLLAAPIWAQDNEPAKEDLDNVLEEVQVIGTRKSIQDAIAIKRDADSLIEAVTMEDIGQMPDISIAESLERVSGVTANESRGQATQLIIRGLSPDLTLTTFNGRELAGEQDGREVQLGLFPSELIQQARVVKSPTADLVEGGVAGTVDLRSIKPLDRNKRVMSINARGIHSDSPKNDLVSNQGWRGAFTFIDQLNDGKLGIAAGLAYSKDPQNFREFTTGERQPAPDGRWEPPGQNRGFGDIDGDGAVDFVPGVNRGTSMAWTNEKIGGIFNLQWRPTDATELTLDAMYTRRELIGGNSSFKLVANQYTKFNPNTLITDDAAVGTATTLAGGEVNGALATGFDVTGGAILEIGALDRVAESDFSSFGLNLVHDFENWTLNGDLAYSGATLDLVNIQTAMQQKGVSFSYDATGSAVPSITFNQNLLDSLNNPVIGYGPDKNNGLPDVSTVAFTPNMLVHGTNGVEDDIVSTRWDLSRELDTAMFTQVSFGVRYLDRSKQRFRDEDWVGLRYHPFSSFSDQDKAAAIENGTNVVSPSPFGDYLTDTGANLPTEWFYIDGRKLVDLIGVPNMGLNVNDVTVNTFDIDENYLSGYVQLDFKDSFGDIPYRGNIGLRVVETETISNAVTSTFTATVEDGVITAVQADPIDPNNINTIAYKNTYRNVLPSFNLVVDASDDVLLRFAVAKTMTRPNFQQLGNAFTVNNAVSDPGETLIDDVKPEGKAGNPYLDAFEAWQYDLGIEWYPSDDITLTANLFLKDVEGFIINDLSERTLTDQNGLPVKIVTNQPVNEDGTSQISGIELAYAHAFTGLPAPFDGLGVSFNYTYLDTDIETPFLDTYIDRNGATPNGTGCFDPNSQAPGRICSTFTQGPNNFSKQAFNGVLYYNKGPINIRFATRYKDEYSRQGGKFELPRYQKAQTYFDLSMGYKVSKDLRLLATVTNLTNEPVELYWQDPWGSDSKDSLQRYSDFGRKFVFGFRYNL